jgi:hypothetical protein
VIFRKKGKVFFFEKKNQKTFVWLSPAPREKVFWSFFSKKDCFPAYGAALAIGLIAALITLPPWALRGGLPPGAPYAADAGNQILAQRYFLTQPWHWNTLHIDRLMQPWGVNLAHTDGIPLAALIAKALRPLLPPFDQVGTLWLALCWLCQPAAAVFALRATGERRLLPSLCVALIAASMPTFLARLRHPSMSAHFLLLILLGCYFHAVKGARVALWAGCGVAAMLLLVHPYLLFMGMALPAAAFATLWFRHDPRWREAAGALAITTAAIALFTHCLGLADGGSVGIYGYHTLNLAGFIYPARSGLFPGFPIAAVDATGGQGEGYAYLGAGLLLVLALDTLRPRLLWAAIIRHAGLALACAMLLLLALSHRVFLFHIMVFHLHTATGLLDSFRASGRFVWVPTYVLLVGGVALLIRGRPKIAMGVLPVAACLAVWDGSAIWAHDRAFLATPAPWYFDAGRMRTLLREHDELTILPPAGCIKGFDMGVVQPLYLASETGMATSTMYIGRKLHPQSCDVAEALTANPKPGELILVQPGFVQTAKQSPMAPQCRQMGAYAACTLNTHSLAGLPQLQGDIALPPRDTW